jgi:hypothetical protein
MKKHLLLLALCAFQTNLFARFDTANLARSVEKRKLKKIRRQTVTQMLPVSLLGFVLWQARQVLKEGKEPLSKTELLRKVWQRTLRTFAGGEGISNREKWTNRILALMVASGLLHPWGKTELDRDTQGYL